MSYEYTLLQKQNLILYQIPPLASAKGHYLDTWKDMIWNGNIKVISKNGNVLINFLNPDNSIFACCPVPHKWDDAIQKCVDSSRGFAIRLQNPNGKYAWVGLAFRDRNDAFDFNVCFSDWEQKRELELNPNKFAKEFENMQDFSIKDGQKLVLSFGDQKNENKGQAAKPKSNLSDFKFNIPGQNPGFSAPKQQEPAFQKPPPTQTGSTGFGSSDQGFNSWGATNNVPKKNEFADFGNFNFGMPAQTNNQPQNFSQGFGGNSIPSNINQQQQNKPGQGQGKQYDNLLDL